MKLSGVAGLDPRKAQLAVDLKGIEILPFQPYFADKVNITLTGGAVAARGNLAVEVPPEGAIRASYRGNAGIANLHTIDKANAADFLVWKSLFFDGISLSRLQPLKLDIKEVALSDFYSRLILSAEGKLNVQQIMSKPEAEAEAAAAEAQRDAAAPVPPAAAEPSPPAVTAGAAESKPAAAPGVTPLPPPPDYKITVQKLTLQGGNVNFSDFFIKPNYTADMKELGGRVTGLSSDLGTTADVELRGQVSDAPLEILGKVNPLTGNLFLDLKASVKGMELPQFTPYSSKYAGYAIEKGKLTVNIGYKIENRKLEAQNNVYLDQLTFGEKIESPDATKLPVLLAVSLLKDRNGVIDINLPIGGSLDDPKFSVGGIIIQVIVNLIVKAVTAPFALIGSLFGGGEELAYAEFDYGSTVITEPTQKKLETLAKALTERPGLKLEIAGRVDPENDAEGLKKAAVERKVKAQKLADQVKKGEAAESVDSVTVDKDEYPKYLERAYKQEKFPKPRNVIGMAKDLPPEEMEKLMLTHAQAGDEDLRTLALQRAQTVKDHLIHKGKVPEERVFTVAPKLTADDAKDKDKAKLSRVDFSLK
ncbi:MAG: ATPase involved in pili bisis [Proteobacteria bacterium]|nr:ATPase involved in pili bisis [Pseudomonadota bacterium]